MKRKLVLSAMLVCSLAIGLALVGCDNGTTNPDAPEITKFVVGIRLGDYEQGKPEKTVFNKGDHFYYGFEASDPQGDWKKMVHTIKLGGKTYDQSWSFEDGDIGNKTVKPNAGYNLGGGSGTYEMTWYILDQAGNKSNVITRTITVN